MKQIDLIDVYVTAPHYLQCDVSVSRAGDDEMSVPSLQNRPEFKHCSAAFYFIPSCDEGGGEFVRRKKLDREAILVIRSWL